MMYMRKMRRTKMKRRSRKRAPFSDSHTRKKMADGDVVKEYYTEPQDEEESYDEYSSSSDSSYVFLSQFIV